MELAGTDACWSDSGDLTCNGRSGLVLTRTSGVTNSWWFIGGKGSEVCSLASSSDVLLPEVGMVVSKRRGTGDGDAVRGWSGCVELECCDGACAETVLRSMEVEGEVGCGCGWCD